MIDTHDFVKSIYGALGSAFPNVPLWDKDLQKIKDSERPCYVVDLDDMTDWRYSGCYEASDVSAVVYYFGDNRNNGWGDLLKQKNKLYAVLSKPHSIDGFVWQATSVDFAINRDDMVMTAIFNITMIQEIIENDDAETMEELIYKKEEI